MFRALASPIKAERSRITKERLEASLAGLCELELLKQRQECLVLGALCLGDYHHSSAETSRGSPGGCTTMAAWGELSRRLGLGGDHHRGDSGLGGSALVWGEPAVRSVAAGRCAPPDAPSSGGGASAAADENGLISSRRHQPSSLQCTPWGLLASVEQQVSELRVNQAETKPVESPAEPVDCRLASAQPQPAEDCLSRRDGAPETCHRSALPHSPSATFRSPEAIAAAAAAAGDTKAGENSPCWDANATADGKAKPGDAESTEPTEEDYQQAQRIEVYISGLIHRRPAPQQRPSKPRTSLAHDTRAMNVTRQSSLCRKDPDQHPPATQASGQVMPELHATPQGPEGAPLPQACHGLDQERYLGTGFPEEPPVPYHHVVQHQPGLYPRPRQPSSVMASTQCSPPLDYPSCRVLQQDSSNSEPDSPQHFHLYPSPPPQHPLPAYTPPSSEEQLVNAEYIPAQPCRSSTRSSAHPHPHSSSIRGSAAGLIKPSPGRSTTYSPERPGGSHHHDQHQQQQPAAAQVQHSRSRGAPSKKCRGASDDRAGGAGGARKPGKKACRSQSENSLQRVPERKYNTVERDGGGSGSGGGGGGGGTRGSQQPRGKKNAPQGSGGSYRRWRSTLELSQDEADQPPAQQAHPPPAQREHGGQARRTRKSRPAAPPPPSYAYAPHGNHHHHHPHPHYHHVEYQLEREPAPLQCQPHDDGYAHLGHGGESESSLSEADSPDSSSLSSDSDESGGLVWPQQLPPQLSLPAAAPPSSQQAAGGAAPLQPKAFVKIKASHALKKKILRFRTGSLKVMTTV